eukprot:COSAG05_NODE_2969_length_2456_cov_1.963089_2_plen_359_part_00
MVGTVAGVSAPNTSLASIPVGYFGGHHNQDTSVHGVIPCPAAGCRPAVNLQMLSKMRIVMVEKWVSLHLTLLLRFPPYCLQLPFVSRSAMRCSDPAKHMRQEGHCYDGCMYNASKHMPCFPSCNVERDMLKTLSQVKALNQAVKGVVYLNTLMAFPFYALSGRFADANALLIDMYTGKPVELTNDEGMQHVWVYDWGNPTGRQLFIDFVSDFLSKNEADGIFADKWGGGASRVNATTWKICNNRCGFINNSQAAAYNAGAILVREQISALMHMNASSPAEFGGLLYADGLSNGAKCPKATYPDGSVKINLVGGWATWRPEHGYVTEPYRHMSNPDPERYVLGAIRQVSRASPLLSTDR